MSRRLSESDIPQYFSLRNRNVPLQPVISRKNLKTLPPLTSKNTETKTATEMSSYDVQTDAQRLERELQDLKNARSRNVELGDNIEHMKYNNLAIWNPDCVLVEQKIRTCAVSEFTLDRRH